MKKLALILLLIPVIASAQSRGWQQQAKPDPKDPLVQLQKFNQFFRYLNGSYVDTINYVKLVESAITGALSDLDPHSAYVSAEDMVEVEQSFEGSFSGIGIEFNVLNDTIFVVNTIPGGPSQKVGLMPNDRIVEIDGVSAIGMKQSQVPGKLRGPKGTAVSIKVLRRGEAEPLDFRIVRDNIPLNTIDAAYICAPGTGYIKVNRFAATTTKEFGDAFNKLGKPEALVVDLRGNGGGLLEQAISLSNFFMPSGEVVVSTEGKMVPPERYTTRSDGKFLKGKLIILIDESSASASEIVAGAIQDWDRGVIVGRRSFGKGLVQRQFPLLDGSSVRITVARYHTPTGRAIQRPFEDGKKDEYYASFYQRFESGVDSLKDDESMKYTTLRLGRTVYGGGGIYPDIYVPIDTTGYSTYLGRLVRRGVMGEWVLQYLDANRAKLEKQYASFGQFDSEFAVDTTMIQSLTALGIKRDVPFDAAGYATSERTIKTQLKALIAERLWSMTEYYRVFNAAGDPAFARAMELLSSWDREAAKFVYSGPNSSRRGKNGPQ